MKARNILMSVLAAGCLSVACFAEAASVALLPLINNSDYENPEELNAAYHSAAVRTINNVEGFTLVDSDALTNVLDKNFEGSKLPSEVAMKNIAMQSGVDLVVAMQLDTLNSISVFGKNEDRLVLELKGLCVSYNAVTGKYAKHKIYDDTDKPMDVYARSNFELEQWTNNVRREMNKVLGNKKFKAEKPKFGW